MALRRASASAVSIAAANVEKELSRAIPVRLAPIGIDGSLIAGETPDGIGLRQVSAKKNLITDDAAWFDAHALTPKRDNRPSELVPATLRSARRTLLIHHPGHVVGAYESGFLVVASPGKRPRMFDARAALTSGPRPFRVSFGQLVGDTLVLQLAYNGYAHDSGGKNGYLAAFQASDGQLLWSSTPLRANGAGFVISGEYVISGYGFTAEDDHLFVTSLATGALVRTLPLESGPSYILEKDNRLYVRTYDHDYVFASKEPFTGAMPARLADAGRPTDEELEHALASCLAVAIGAVEAEDGDALEDALAGLRVLSERDVRARAVIDPLTGVRERLKPGADRGIDLATVIPIAVEAPPFERVRPKEASRPAGPAPRLVQIAERRADPVRSLDAKPPEDGPWFIAPIEEGKLPTGVRQDIPSHYAAQSLRAILPSGDRLLLVYGGRYLVVLDRAAQTERIFDLEGFRHPPRADPARAKFAVQDVTDARVVGDTVYVCNGGGSYAREVYGKKGFVSAISLATGELIWRSKPLVCNANLALYGNEYILTGYGFTDERDFLYLIRRRDGEVVARARLRTGPGHIALDGHRATVETYGDTYTFEIRNR